MVLDHPEERPPDPIPAPVEKRAAPILHRIDTTWRVFWFHSEKEIGTTVVGDRNLPKKGFFWPRFQAPSHIARLRDQWLELREMAAMGVKDGQA
jgi:hypothetical protein